MATYKVPQDVEADDKLIGPFTFRQFIYLFVVVGAIGLAWALGRIFLPLASIPLPIILLFGALALPIRKDQPMETYLAAIISFYVKPRVRLWDPDGIENPIEITAPKTDDETIRTKDLSQAEAEKRLGYLANLADTRGWAIRGAEIQPPDSALNSDVYFEAQQTPDLLDESNQTLHIIDQKLSQSNVARRKEAIKSMSNQINATPTLQPAVSQPQSTNNAQIVFNPYPEEMRQTVVQPLEDENKYQAPAPVSPQEKTTSNKQVSADIISLANNNDLSIETIAREANRINSRGADKGEVIISLH